MKGGMLMNEISALLAETGLHLPLYMQYKRRWLSTNQEAGLC